MCMICDRGRVKMMALCYWCCLFLWDREDEWWRTGHSCRGVRTMAAGMQAQCTRAATP